MKAIMKDDHGLAWGITLFLMILAVSAITFTALGPAIEGISEGFDTDYRTEHMTETGNNTADTLYSMYGFILIITLLVGLAFVIVRAIQSKGVNGGY